jgi:hypothetical protein
VSQHNPTIPTMVTRSSRTSAAWVDRSAEHLAGQRFMQISGTSCARGIAAYLLFLSSSSHEEIFFSRLSISARISARGLVLPAKNWTMASG